MARPSQRTACNVEPLAGGRWSVTFATLQPGQKQGQHQINKMSHFSRCYSSWCHQRLRTDMSPGWNGVNNYKPCASLRARPKRHTHLAPIKCFLTTMWQSHRWSHRRIVQSQTRPFPTYRIWKTPLCLPRPSQPHLIPLLRSWLGPMVQERRQISSDGLLLMIRISELNPIRSYNLGSFH